MRASLGQDLSSLREQQNNINESLGEIMDSIDNQIEEPKLVSLYVKFLNTFVLHFVNDFCITHFNKL
jgi:hypothetical protein